MKKLGVQIRASSPSSRNAHAEQVDGFVDAVGEQDLLGVEAEVRGDDALDGLALGVDGEAFGGESAAALEHAGQGAKVFSLKSRRRASRPASGGWYSGIARTARRGCGT